MDQRITIEPLFPGLGCFEAGLLITFTEAAGRLLVFGPITFYTQAQRQSG